MKPLHIVFNIAVHHHEQLDISWNSNAAHIYSFSITTIIMVSTTPMPLHTLCMTTIMIVLLSIYVVVVGAKDDDVHDDIIITCGSVIKLQSLSPEVIFIVMTNTIFKMIIMIMMILRIMMMMILIII